LAGVRAPPMDTTAARIACPGQPCPAGPHDHGDSWAIYGQAVKHTEMTESKRTDDGSVPGKATIEKAKTYRMERGQEIGSNLLL